MEIDITINEEIVGMIAQKYNDCIHNIRFIWVYLVHEKGCLFAKEVNKTLEKQKSCYEYNG